MTRSEIDACFTAFVGVALNDQIEFDRGNLLRPRVSFGEASTGQKLRQVFEVAIGRA